LSDNLPVESLDAMTLQQTIETSENQILNCQSAVETAAVGKKHEIREQWRPSEIMSHLTGSGQKYIINTSDKYQSSGRHTRRTGNKSPFGRDSRQTAAAAVPVREKPKAGGGGGRKFEVTQRSVRNDTRQVAVNQPVVPMIARTIYTSDRWTRSGGDQTTERPTSSNTVALTVTTGLLYFPHLQINGTDVMQVTP